MAHAPTGNTLQAAISALETADLIFVSAASGAHDLQTSISRHLSLAFGLSARFPSQITDQALHAAMTDALGDQRAKRFINQFFNRAADLTIDDATCLAFFRTLAVRLLSDTADSLEAELTCPAPVDQPYSICSLAQAIWARQIPKSQRDAFILATLLRYPLLPPTSPRPRPAAPTLELGNYLELGAVTRHLLAPKGASLAKALFDTLEAPLYAYGRRYRIPTRRELASGIIPNLYGKVMFAGAALNAPAAEALDALLHSRAFGRWALRLAAVLYEPAEPGPTAKDLALAEQALVDVLYPPASRRAGYIMDFELFSPHNAQIPPWEIRQDLINSVQANLRCEPALAEIASELLLRRFAPELLLDGYPADFIYQPDLNWILLRQAAIVLRMQRQPLTYQQAMAICTEPLDVNAADAHEALRNTLARQHAQAVAHPTP